MQKYENNYQVVKGHEFFYHIPHFYQKYFKIPPFVDSTVIASQLNLKATNF